MFRKLSLGAPVTLSCLFTARRHLSESEILPVLTSPFGQFLVPRASRLLLKLEKREKGRENLQSDFLEERDIINMLYLIPSVLGINK